MTDLTPLLTELRRAGYRTVLHDDGEKWLCVLSCNSDVLPETIGRPMGSGETPEAALLAANVARLGMEAGQHKDRA